MSNFFERFKRLNDYTPTDDEIEAGLSRLTNLSAFGTPLSLARKTNMTPEQILMRPAEECYMILLYDFESAEYEKKLRKIKEDNQAMMNSVK